ncbi:MAG: spore germination protein, partial [Clostridiales bacterium]|nr:spore germination protein [Candidatus Equinaster intestinalis]
MNGNIMDYKNKYIFKSIDENIQFFGELFKNDGLYRKREFRLANSAKTKACLLFFDGMVNSLFINDSVMRPLLNFDYSFTDNLTDGIINHVLYANEVKKERDISLILSDILYGDSVLLIDNCEYAILIDTKGWRTRGISEPNDERVLKGPREGFDEAILPNLAMLKRKLITPDLAIENLTVGRRTETKVYVCYLKSVVKQKTVEKIKAKIEKIDIDGVLDSNYISELINDNGFSFFKTVGTTERPDVVAAKLLEGRIAVFVDGTPVVLTVPYIFAENFQSDDDYYQHYTVAAIGRVLRYACFYISTFVPSLFAALVVFNPQFLPVTFFTTIASSRAGVPFSTFFESLLLIIVFELLKETGVRMQQSVGHAL